MVFDDRLARKRPRAALNRAIDTKNPQILEPKNCKQPILLRFYFVIKNYVDVIFYNNAFFFLQNNLVFIFKCPIFTHLLPHLKQRCRADR